jgi:hypothetical protein
LRAGTHSFLSEHAQKVRVWPSVLFGTDTITNGLYSTDVATDGTTGTITTTPNWADSNSATLGIDRAYSSGTQHAIFAVGSSETYNTHETDVNNANSWGHETNSFQLEQTRSRNGDAPNSRRGLRNLGGTGMTP